jgi:hypothetical protein
MGGGRGWRRRRIGRRRLARRHIARRPWWRITEDRAELRKRRRGNERRGSHQRYREKAGHQAAYPWALFRRAGSRLTRRIRHGKGAAKSCGMQVQSAS